MTDPFNDLVRALDAREDATPDTPLRLDLDRVVRTGIPEFINGQNKTTDEIVRAIQRLAESNGRALTTRITASQADLVSPHLGDLAQAHHDRAEVLIASARPATESGGRVGIICAGTSDRGVALEAQLVAEEMGCAVMLVIDVGVAGLHRLIAPLRAVMAWSPDALVIAAGMDGALPSVVAGLVDVPVIGLPVSTGYGLGGDGTAALYSMLQSCAPGLAVVNIDNGVGAGSTAALIANRAATARNQNIDITSSAE